MSIDVAVLDNPDITSYSPLLLLAQFLLAVFDPLEFSDRGNSSDLG